MVYVFMAAIEALPFMWAQHPRYMLGSYLYMRKWSKKTDKLFWDEAKDFRKLMVDSGAHTYFVYEGTRGSKRFQSGKMKAPPPPEDYTHDYCTWLKEHEDQISSYVELDIDAIVGWPRQMELRQIFDSYNLNPLPVWHETNKWSFENYCQKCDFVGISGIELDDTGIKKKLEIADRYGTNVHVFGYTRAAQIDGLCYYGSFYSCDSSSWLAGGKYAKPFKFVNGQLIGISEADFRKKWATTTMQAFTDIGWQERAQWNLLEFNKAIEHWEALHKKSEVQGRFEVIPGIDAFHEPKATSIAESKKGKQVELEVEGSRRRTREVVPSVRMGRRR